MKRNYYLTLFLFLFVFIGGYGQCNSPSSIAVANITQTSAQLSWVANGQTAWEVVVQPSGAPAPTVSDSGIATTSTPFAITGLTGCTSYQFFVRSVCAPGVTSNWVGPFHFSTSSTLSCTATVNGNTATVIATGGTAPYQYSVNGGPYASSPVFGFLSPGTYAMQVRDAFGCTCTSVVVINSFGLTISAIQGNPASTLIAVINGGTAPFTYQWGLNATTISAATGNSLTVSGQPGTYSLTVTDANGLIATATYTVFAVPIYANDDAITMYPINGGNSVSSVSVLANDMTDGYPANPNNITLTPLTVPTGFSLNPDGTISVLPGTASGTYSLTYQICFLSQSAYCDSATVTITIMNEGILLNAFIDTNNNGNQEVGEPDFIHGQFGYELNNNGTVNHAFSANGEYFISENNPINSYDLTYVIDPAFAGQYAVAPASYSNVSVSGGITVYNFPVTEIPFTDSAVFIYAYTPPRPGFTYTNYLVYQNNGNQMMTSGTVTFNKDSAVAITNVSPAATTTTATGFTYDFTNLAPGESRVIEVAMQVPTIPAVALGGILTNTVSVTMPAGDINIVNNNNNLSQVIVGSYDPNDITERHGGKIVHSAFTANDYLAYTIQFENTGTFYAENVRVNDVLDAKLDETSIRMVNTSHNYTLNRVGNDLNWNFNGIDLQPAEKGYITFEVKPKAGFAIGDIIPNAASIFFDFNPPIVTNIFNTEFVASLSVPQFENNPFLVYPNPTNGLVTISLKNNTDKIDAVVVNDMLGKTVYAKTIDNPIAEVDLSRLSAGIYFVKINVDQQEKVMKIVKQ
ncbi:DUF7619 domain-containing protein [Flavobacterium sp.]|uniref:DUF7619 domain-containing protein n=1 Tax=Flavobacterium sp. TaxID=239 RepID=UPI003D6BE124